MAMPSTSDPSLHMACLYTLLKPSLKYSREVETEEVETERTYIRKFQSITILKEVAKAIVSLQGSRFVVL